MGAHPAELVADFRHFYSLDFIDLAVEDPALAKLLYRQLPEGARVHAAINPASTWSTDTYFLRDIAFSARTLAWQNTRDASKKEPRNAPKPTLFETSWEKAERVLFEKPTNRITSEKRDLKSLLALPRTPINSEQEISLTDKDL